MKKITTVLASTLLLIIGSFLVTTKAYADIPGPNGETINYNASDSGSIIIIGAGIIIVVVALVSFIVIRTIRRKKNNIKEISNVANVNDANK